MNMKMKQDAGLQWNDNVALSLFNVKLGICWQSPLPQLHEADLTVQSFCQQLHAA